MIRRLFTIASALSLLICVATGVFWERSFPDGDGLSERDAKGRFWIQSHKGMFHLAWANVLYAHAYDGGGHPFTYYDGPIYPIPDIYGAPWAKRWHWGKAYFDHAGVRYGTGERGGAFEYWVAAPCWMVAAATSLLPILSVIRFLKRRRRLQTGCCTHCGYDLRASKDRCPECGTLIPQKTEAAA